MIIIIPLYYSVSMATSSEEVVSSFPKMTIHVSSDGAGAVHPDPTPACVNVTMDSSQQSRTVSIEEELIHHINHSSGKEMVQSYLTYPVQISLFIDKKKLFGVKSSLFSQLALYVVVEWAWHEGPCCHETPIETNAIAR